MVKKALKLKRRIIPIQGGKVGLPPGTPVYTGQRPDQPVHITLINYDEHAFDEKILSTVQDAFDTVAAPPVSWVNIDEISNVPTIETLCRRFDVHPLVIEDIVHTDQRPKTDIYDHYIFIVLRMLRYDTAQQSVTSEQVSLILSDRFLFTFQERPGDVFEQIRQRLRAAKGRIRKLGPDYLAYALMDAIVDNYFLILEAVGERIGELEDDLLNRPSKNTLAQLHRLKNELMTLRRSVWPLRELISSLERGESALIQPTTRVYLRDLYDHTIQVAETLESFRDMVGGMLDLYLSSVSNRTNDIMKVLTVIASIFIPLSFVTGVFGMNFEHMPELSWQWAYPVGFWTLIVLLVAGMIVYFKKNKWL